MSRMPNHFIERTRFSALRALSRAAHAKRCAKEV